MNAKFETATFAAGCFWGVEAMFRKVKGVVDVIVGYTAGTKENPTYRDVCAGTTGHAEAVLVTYDPSTVSYQELLKVFFESHDPTTLNQQGPDIGHQYRSGIFYHSNEQKLLAEEFKQELESKNRFPKRATGASDEHPEDALVSHRIVTEIVPASMFWKAEEYHQRYLEKQGASACPV